MKLLIAICLLSIAISALSQNNADGSVPGTPLAAESELKTDAQTQTDSHTHSHKGNRSLCGWTVEWVVGDGLLGTVSKCLLSLFLFA